MISPIAVTISRQYGARGVRIGRRLAEGLGFRYLDREILRQVAGRIRQDAEALSGREERLSSLWETIVQSIEVAVERAFPSPGLSHQPFDRELFELEGEVIREVASRENTVIVGRAGFWVLRDHPGLASVFLHAEKEGRAALIGDRYELVSGKEALAWTERCDRERERYIKAMTGLRWQDVANFQLCIDTGRVSDAATVDMILRLVEDVRAGQGE